MKAVPRRIFALNHQMSFRSVRIPGGVGERLLFSTSLIHSADVLAVIDDHVGRALTVEPHRRDHLRLGDRDAA